MTSQHLLHLWHEATGGTNEPTPEALERFAKVIQWKTQNAIALAVHRMDVCNKGGYEIRREAHHIAMNTDIFRS